MAMGTVTFYNSERRFGFIQPDGGAKDVRVQFSALDQAGLRFLTIGQRVTFDIQKSEHGRDTVVDLHLE